MPVSTVDQRHLVKTSDVSCAWRYSMYFNAFESTVVKCLIVNIQHTIVTCNIISYPSLMRATGLQYSGE